MAVTEGGAAEDIQSPKRGRQARSRLCYPSFFPPEALHIHRIRKLASGSHTPTLTIL